MKKIFFILSPFLFFGSLFGQDANRSPVAIVTKVVQVVDFKIEEENWKKANIGQTLTTGNEVKTGQRSLAIVKFIDNSILRIRENSSVILFANRVENAMLKNTEIKNGRLNFKISEQENDEFRFTTPTMVASIRGTSGFFDVDAEGNTVLFVNEGSVEVRGTQGNQQTNRVGAGNYTEVTNVGNVEVKEGGEEQQSQFNQSNKTRTRQIIIKSPQGDIVIEYLDDELD